MEQYCAKCGGMVNDGAICFNGYPPGCPIPDRFTREATRPKADDKPKRKRPAKRSPR